MLGSLAEERSKDDELMHTLEDVINLQDIVAYVKPSRCRGVRETFKTLWCTWNLYDIVAYVKPSICLGVRETIRKTSLKQKAKSYQHRAYHQGYILHKFKESEEFTDTLLKSLKMSKSNITFKINLYKLFRWLAWLIWNCFSFMDWFYYDLIIMIK